jgi:hypothetical protein
MKKAVEWFTCRVCGLRSRDGRAVFEHERRCRR